MKDSVFYKYLPRGVQNNENLYGIFINQTTSYNNMLSSKGVRKYSGDYKRVYRLLIVHYMASAFLSDVEEFNWSQYKLSRMFLSTSLADLEPDLLNEVFARSKDYLIDNLKFAFSEDSPKTEKILFNDTKLSHCVNFFFAYLKNNKKTIFSFNELSGFWNLNDYFNFVDVEIDLHPHHLIELKPFTYRMPVPTFPDYFAFQDMVNVWNDTIEKLALVQKVTFYENREIHYSYNTSLRSTIIFGTQFVETYLYYIYYNFKASSLFENKLLKRNDIRKINDTNIVEQLLYKEFPNMKSKIDGLYQEYKDILEIRNSFVHISAFVENGYSRLQELVNADIVDFSKKIQTMVDMVDAIENELGSYGILFWRNRVKWPIFAELEKTSALMK